jgi:hypothetical protein
MNVSAFFAISAKVDGTTPVELATAALLKVTISLERQRVKYGWVRVIQVARKVLAEDKRNSTLLALAAIGETNAIGLNELSRNCRRSISVHGLVLLRND